MSVQTAAISFNQDSTCFGVATHNGFRAYDCGDGAAFREVCRRDFEDGGLSIVELLYKTAIVALVGGGPTPKFPPTQVVIWDEQEGRQIGCVTTRGIVRAVRLRRDRIVVVQEHKVLVFSFDELKLQHQVETISNPHGIVALSTSPDHPVLACPGLHTGQVRVELYALRRTRLIEAHKSALSALALTQDGSLLATSSEKGTLIRIFSTHDSVPLKELRRGTDPALIYSVCFNREGTQLACTSDTGTVHIFSTAGAEAAGRQAAEATGGGGALLPTLSYDEDVGGGEERPPASSGNNNSQGGGSALGTSAPKNKTFLSADYLGIVKSILPKSRPINYLTSEWSFAHYKLPALEVASGGKAGGRAVAAFTGDGTLCIASTSGYFYRLGVDPGGQEGAKIFPLTTMYWPG